MSDAKKTTNKSFDQHSPESVETMINENLSFEKRVSNFFESSKQKYFDLKQNGKLQKYTVLALLLSFSLGVLSQSSGDMMASLFAFMQ